MSAERLLSVKAEGEGECEGGRGSVEMKCWGEH